ncbi:MAG TPA: AAA family ATPase, partial [Lentzea sp.]
MTSHFDHATALAKVQKAAGEALREVADRHGIDLDELETGPVAPDVVAGLIAATTPAPPLPTPGDRFVGREHEIAELEQLITESRLVTLVGPPGVGKTRLALELLRHDDVRWVDLSAFTDAQVEALVLGDLRAVLVLDTCEHVLT